MALLGTGPVLRSRLDDLHRRWQTPDRRVDATFAMGAYAWFLGIAAIGPYLVAGVVPDIAPDNVAVRTDDDGSLDAVALRRLDVVGRSPTALHLALHDHLALVVDRLRDECRIGRRALWAVAADSWRRSSCSPGSGLVMRPTPGSPSARCSAIGRRRSTGGGRSWRWGTVTGRRRSCAASRAACRIGSPTASAATRVRSGTTTIGWCGSLAR